MASLEKKKSSTVEKKTSVIVMRFTPAQRTAIEQRAEKCGVKIGVWVRSVLIQVAKSKTTDKSRGYIYVREPNGMTL